MCGLRSPLEHSSNAPHTYVPTNTTRMCNMPVPSNPPAEINFRLCRHCEVLQFDDKTLGGTERRGDDGRCFLVLDELDKPQIIKTKYRCEDTYPDFPRLEASAEAGCGFCLFLRSALLQAELARPSGVSTKVTLVASYLWKLQGAAHFSGALNAYSDRGLASLLLGVYFMPDVMSEQQEEPVERPVIAFDIDSDCGKSSSWLRLESSPITDMLSTASIDWLRGIKKRQEDVWPIRDNTERNGDSGFSPTRLIDLEHDGDNQLARLVHSVNISGKGREHVKYAALSYCWGPPEDAALQFKTTPATLGERTQSIDIKSMTEVMKDAVTVCRALNIRYLWIDAVCIVQGDGVDWEREASKMGLVYSNAEVTIATISSTSCHQGFLKRPQDLVFKMPFRSSLQPGISGYYNLRRTSKDTNLNRLRITSGNPRNQDISESVWGMRAWTFQEYQSSQFSILFGRRKMHVATSEGVISEGETEFLDLDLPTIPFLDRCIYYEGVSDLDTYYDHWMTLAPDFCERELTNPMDKFPALSGLAAYFGSLLEDRYVAGLWKRDLYRELFWTYPPRHYGSPEELVVSLSNSDPYIAPSWSWAVQSNFFEFSLRYFHMIGGYADHQPEYANIEPSVTLNGAGANPMGQIQDARLHITTRVRVLEEDIVPFQDDAFGNALWQIKSADGEYLADCGLDWQQRGVLEAKSQNSQLQLLLLGSCILDVEDAPFGPGQRFVWGLIIYLAPQLVHGSSEKSDTFYRVGVFYSKPKAPRGGTLLFDGCEKKTLGLV